MSVSQRNSQRSCASATGVKITIRVTSSGEVPLNLASDKNGFVSGKSFSTVLSSLAFGFLSRFCAPVWL